MKKFMGSFMIEANALPFNILHDSNKQLSFFFNASKRLSDNFHKICFL